MTSCNEYDANGHQRRVIKCDHGCCGTSSNQQCCDYALSDTVIIVACVVGALLVISIIAVLVVCIISSKKRDRVVRIRQPRRSHEQGRRRAEIPKPPPYSELPPDYSSVTNSMYQTTQSSHVTQSSSAQTRQPVQTSYTNDAYEQEQDNQSYDARQSDVAHQSNGTGQVHDMAGQSTQFLQPLRSTQQPSEESCNSSIYSRPRRENLGAYPPPPASTSASISSVDYRPTQRLIQEIENEQCRKQKDRSANNRKTTQIPVPVKGQRRTESPSTSSTRAASTSTAGRSVSTIDSFLPGIPASDEQNLVSSREQRDITRAMILRKLQSRRPLFDAVSTDYI